MSSEVKECHYPWTWITVSSNGDVRPCCYAQPIGSLDDSTPEEIWNGKNIQAVRRSIKNNKVDIACSRATCKYVNGKRADWTLQYFLILLSKARRDPAKAFAAVFRRLNTSSARPVDR